jgi:transcriptional regulator
VHAPLLVTGERRIQFHVARRNRASAALPGANVVISVAGRDAYQSASWYVSDNLVPTWLYETVEIEGAARELGEPELVAQLDRLSAIMEGRYSPERPWSREKMTPGKFEGLVKAIVGFEVDPTAIRGTRKFEQHKASADIEAAIAGQQGAGRDDIVAAIRALRRDR